MRTRNIVRITAIAAALLMLADAGVAAAGGLESARRAAVPSRQRRAAIHYRTVIGGLNDPAGFTFGPKGTLIYFLERGTGRVRTYDLSKKRLGSFFTISGVDGSGERGALGIALSPNWPATPFMYVYVTRRSSSTGPLQNQLIRIRRSNGHGVAKRVLFTQPVSSATNHNGGRILFGPDGKLYIVIGENANPANAQILGNLRGKVLRVNAAGNNNDGTAAAGNFHGRIWSYGLRNSFGFTFDPTTGSLWETENGPTCNDEINLIQRGGNYGWGSNQACGSVAAPGDTNNSGPLPRIVPKTYFGSTIGITGAAFCNGCGLGAASEGKLFFGCVNDGGLRTVALNAGRTDIMGAVALILTGPSGAIYSMEVAPNGRIYFSNPNGIFRLVFV